MKVLVLGSGGREHAMVWKLRQSPRISKLYCAPGNGGIAEDAECVAADLKSLDSLVQLATNLSPDLTVVGPELAADSRRGGRISTPRLADLWADARPRRNWSRARALPRSSCSGTASPRRTTRSAPAKKRCTRRWRLFHTPIVVKADGLAAGKGVVIAQTKDEAESVANEMLSGKMLGEAGSRVVLEECLGGRRAVVPGDERRRTRGPAGRLPGPQARLRQRSGTEHRRHGRVLDRPDYRRSRCAIGW